MVAVPDVDPNTGQPIEMMVNSPVLVSNLVRPNASASVPTARPKPKKSSSPGSKEVSRRSTSEVASSRNRGVVKATPDIDGDKSSYQGTDRFFQRASWMFPTSRKPAKPNPVESLVPESDYKQQVLNGKLKGKGLAELRRQGKITDKEFNQLYSVLRNNGIPN